MDRDKPKRKKAVALKYDPVRDQAPRVSAKGQGLVAEKIVALAKEAGVPLKDDPDLIEVLMGLELDEEIPPELYVVVAELLAYVYYVNERYRRVLDRGLATDVDHPAW
ncbi:MAG: EscU/YscU/HrcU family type III secretion system export apparatus switch protein [Proteobacteria bacterium]|nr:EscU/YscU/HrcU family type III secretion system export apparatus switch protein [Pseudomonadota bacterium]MBU1740043.1 EscU/YscU/HrcU family type III secretion system export apparatus switch protein [Pseudomonadota bacterium]